MLTEEQRRDWERDIAYRTAWRENRWVPADRHVVMDDTILAVAAHLTGVEARLAAVTPVVQAACWLCDVHQGDYADNRMQQEAWLARLTERVATYRTALAAAAGEAQPPAGQQEAEEQCEHSWAEYPNGEEACRKCGIGRLESQR